jgi:sugar phosphate isomerase/epimerase
MIEHAHSIGAAGVQANLGRDMAAAAAIRAACEKYGLYLEAAVDSQGNENTAKTLEAAKAAGARCARCACLSGRRYETFSTLEEWKGWVAKSRENLKRIVKMAESAKVAVALENHKDWTAGELAGLMKEYSSEYLGVCLDLGNNLSLLENAEELVERLAPWAISTHVKDIAVEGHASGFQMSEVPLGEGAFDLSRMLGAIRKARPETPMTLEMITRNPLVIPCLAPKYYATMPELPGADLARTMELVRSKGRKLPRIDPLTPAARVEWEEENVRACLHAARTRYNR